ncbi:hypothetical protein ACFLSJ_06630 [Verrucomicrobiota bacterium]
MRKLVIVILTAAAAAITPLPARGFTPSGWIYMEYPYAYDASAENWVYLLETDAQWCVDLSTGNWSPLDASRPASGWVYFSWPYALDWEAGSWLYVNESDTRWCYYFPSRRWSLLGAPPVEVVQLLDDYAMMADINSAANFLRTIRELGVLQPLIGLPEAIKAGNAGNAPELWHSAQITLNEFFNIVGLYHAIRAQDGGRDVIYEAARTQPRLTAASDVLFP